MVKHSWMIRLTVACGVMGLLASACSGSDDPPPVPRDQLPQQFAKTYCAGLASCCDAAHFTYNDNRCLALQLNEFTEPDSRLRSLLTSPNVRYDAIAAGKCLQAQQKALARCVAPSDFELSDCSYMFAGTLSDGSACQKPYECSSGLCNDAGVCADTLREAAHAKAGEVCNGDCVTFGDGETGCSSISIEAAVGACYESDGLYCDRSASFDTPTCVRFSAVGQPCLSAQCAAGAYCDRAADECMPQRDAGPCTGRGECSAKSYCEGLNVSSTGQCLPRKADGVVCKSGEECQNGVCAGGTEGRRTCGRPSVATAAACSGDTTP